MINVSTALQKSYQKFRNLVFTTADLECLFSHFDSKHAIPKQFKRQFNNPDLPNGARYTRLVNLARNLNNVQNENLIPEQKKNITICIVEIYESFIRSLLRKLNRREINFSSSHDSVSVFGETSIVENHCIKREVENEEAQQPFAVVNEAVRQPLSEVNIFNSDNLPLVRGAPTTDFKQIAATVFLALRNLDRFVVTSLTNQNSSSNGNSASGIVRKSMSRPFHLKPNANVSESIAFMQNPNFMNDLNQYVARPNKGSWNLTYKPIDFFNALMNSLSAEKINTSAETFGISDLFRIRYNEEYSCELCKTIIKVPIETYFLEFDFSEDYHSFNIVEAIKKFTQYSRVLKHHNNNQSNPCSPYLKKQIVDFRIPELFAVVNKTSQNGSSRILSGFIPGYQEYYAFNGRVISLAAAILEVDNSFIVRLRKQREIYNVIDSKATFVPETALNKYYRNEKMIIYQLAD